jgi:hypothetical protein
LPANISSTYLKEGVFLLRLDKKIVESAMNGNMSCTINIMKVTNDFLDPEVKYSDIGKRLMKILIEKEYDCYVQEDYNECSLIIRWN